MDDAADRHTPWPPAVFRRAFDDPTDRPRLTARRFELVDVGAADSGRIAAIDVVVLGRVWVLVGCTGASPEVIARIIAETVVAAVRGGASRLVAGPECPPDVAETVVQMGGRPDEFGVAIDL